MPETGPGWTYTRDKPLQLEHEGERFTVYPWMTGGVGAGYPPPPGRIIWVVEHDGRAETLAEDERHEITLEEVKAYLAAWWDRRRG